LTVLIWFDKLEKLSFIKFKTDTALNNFKYNFHRVEPCSPGEINPHFKVVKSNELDNSKRQQVKILNLQVFLSNRICEQNNTFGGKYLSLSLYSETSEQ